MQACINVCYNIMDGTNFIYLQPVVVLVKTFLRDLGLTTVLSSSHLFHIPPAPHV